jgi:hypothetical protein
VPGTFVAQNSAAEVKKQDLTSSVMIMTMGEDIRERKAHAVCIEALRRVTPEQRLLRAFELTDFSRQLFLHGLCRRFPDAGEEETHGIFLERIEKCHNRNW